ncbi:DUF2884 domain-containing protein [Rhodanobacter sp. DHG33]|uniref:DUF2884 domain-containing protein n=1 Tax=Rhodanobacter sp. DHG33 TaxID=2775921 RepID=UPI001784240A|nr:DUF2884 domain-containing protein [Rhodanobacter sp. DHG33]MBD8898410.1 DUF2884 domain-containing protein [Rhodanobacter sp. DHG33]
MFKRHLFPLLTLCALLAGCNGDSNTSHDHITMRGDLVVLSANSGPEATIDKSGSLSVDGKEVAVDEHQRELLLSYYANATAIRQHGIATGRAGAGMAAEVIKGVAETANGDEDAVDKRVEAQTQKITDQAMKICDDLAGIKNAQDQLATSLPAFQPYAALMDATSVSSCRDDNKTERKD